MKKKKWQKEKIEERELQLVLGHIIILVAENHPLTGKNTHFQ